MRTLSFILFWALVSSPALSAAGDVAGNLDDMAKSLATYFPKGTGKILEVHSDKVIVEMPDAEGLTAGVLLSVYREEKPFYHPVTGIPLGHFEEEQTLLEVVEYAGVQKVARPLDPTPTLLPGDLVRLTRARIPIAVLAPTLKSDAGLIQEFMLALEETGRFLVEASPDLDRTERAPFYVATLETVQNGQADRTVHLRLKNRKTQTVLVDATVDLKSRVESDFMIESFQMREGRGK